MKYARQFYGFLYDFLVGDAWELFVGPIVALIVAWGLLQAGISAAIVGILLFVMIVGVGVANIAIALRQSA